MWTHFWDMSSGGGRKEPQNHIFIEAGKEDAKRIFYARFGHNPERVSCTCCGGDYSISEHESLAQLTGFHRGCRSLQVPRDSETGLYKNDDPVIVRSLYLEDGEEPPAGYELSDWPVFHAYRTLDQYLRGSDVLAIRTNEIKPEWRVAEVPEQGYVWVD